jgi:signal transduction histidine kinase/DNA-binding response OmpR family regulator
VNNRLIKYFIISLILIWNFTLAQSVDSEFGIPIITNYLSQDYSANVQNWSAIQAKNGVMYFANVSGVLEYDGMSWNLIKIPNSIVRTLAIDENGIIYVGGINEIGYLNPTNTGGLIYKSLNSYIAKNVPDFGDIWRIIPNKDGLYFQSFNSIFLLQSNKNNKLSFLQRITNNPSIVKWTTRSRINPLHSIGDRIFVHERNVGLQELSNGRLKMLPGGEEFAQDLICIMLPFESEKILIGSLRKGMFIFNGTGFNKFNNDADNYLIENRLYFRGEVLSNGDFALGTQLGGIVIINKHGKLKAIYNKKNGLNNNTVWHLFSDIEGNLWAALDNGIAKILYPSQVRIIDERFGIEGAIQSLKIFNNILYVSTSSGIFAVDLKSNYKRFQKIKNISVQSWDFLSLNGKLYSATNDGVYEIAGLNAKLLNENLRYTYTLYRSKTNPEIIFVGLHNGLAVLHIINGSLNFIGKVEAISNGIVNVSEDKLGNLWCSEISGKIIKVKTSSQILDLKNYVIEKVDDPILNDTGIKTFYFGNEIHFYNSKKIYSYNTLKSNLVESNILKSAFNDTSYKIINIFADDNENLWIVYQLKNKIRIGELSKSTNKLSTYNFLQFSKPINNTEYSISRYYLQSDQEKILWVTTDEKLLRYNLEYDAQQIKGKELKPSISKVISDSHLLVDGHNYFDAGKSDTEVSIDFSSNSIVFEYSLPSFLNENANEFQYMLLGFDKAWSSWSRISKKEYTNLSAGKYSFKVRGKNSEGYVSEISQFNFVILPPWYRTWWANLLGFILILLIINYVVRFRVNYLKRKNIVLERMVNERTQKINEQKITLEKQAEKLLELDRIKSNFFANISHEFRTPLTLIKGQIENVLGIVRDESVRKKLSVAFNNSNRLNRLINQILDLSKLESGTIKLELINFDIVQLIRTRIASFESLAEKNKIRLKFESVVDKINVNIDKDRIEEVIDNLVSNAIKFTNQNGRITVKVEKVFINNSNNAVITVQDSGIGIPEEKLSHIFDRFYRVDNTSTKEYEGSGLGLSIVKELIELHGGTISVQSNVNKGTTFTINLPLDEFEESVLENPNEDTEKKINEESKPVILIVEDNSDVRNYIKENLESNYRVEIADNGETGITKAIEIIPDLIITDVMMPKVDGFQLCTNLKNDLRTSHIPIIILTAKADEENKISGLSIGADEFLAKPFSPRELEIRVGNLIRIRHLLREKYKEISVIRSEDVKAEAIEKEFLEKIFELIKNNIENQQLSVQMLADKMAMSVSQLNRKLNALINQSAGKLIRSTKLDYAAKLLEKNAGNITEIAYRVGFSDVSSFTNSFKEKFGKSPSEYQKSTKN